MVVTERRFDAGENSRCYRAGRPVTASAIPIPWPHETVAMLVARDTLALVAVFRTEFLIS